MKFKKTILTAGAITTLGVAGLGGINAASAQSSSNDSLIDKLASKFNLNKSDVQAVFDEDKSEKEAQMQADFSERLQELVDDGKLTADQKTLIENKSKELKEARDAERSELESWASQNGIDAKYLMFGKGRSDDRLQEAVDDGEITAEQKSAIEQKQDELDERRKESRDSLEAWAKENDIDIDLLHGFGGGGGPGGGHGGMDRPM